MITLTTIINVVDGQLQISNRRAGVPAHHLELIAGALCYEAQKTALESMSSTLISAGVAVDKVLQEGPAATKLHDQLVEKLNQGGKN